VGCATIGVLISNHIQSLLREEFGEATHPSGARSISQVILSKASAIHEGHLRSVQPRVFAAESGWECCCALDGRDRCSRASCLESCGHWVHFSPLNITPGSCDDGMLALCAGTQKDRSQERTELRTQHSDQVAQHRHRIISDNAYQQPQMNDP
jgi:hypothetical protein